MSDTYAQTWAAIAAGEPNYYPGSQWAKWEDEALRQIEEAW